MATNSVTGATPIPPGLRLSHDLNDALTTWSTSQRTVIGLAADFADSSEWMTTTTASAAHWIAGVADIEVSTAREWSEYDHVPDYATTGHTVVEELQLRCAPCHQRRHDQEAVA